MTLETTATIKIQLEATRIRSGFGVEDTVNAPRLRISSGWDDGITSGCLNVLWHKTYSMTGAKTENVDLRGSLSGIVGEAGVNFADVRGLLLRNKSSRASGHTIKVTHPAGSGWTALVSGALKLRRGTNLLVYTPALTGYVTAAANKVMRLSGQDDGTQATAFDVDVVILGIST